MARRNPYNQPQPAEWETMSPKLKKRWRRAHWRPHEWMVVVPLKRFATRKASQRSGAERGEGMNSLADKLEKNRTNPSRKIPMKRRSASKRNPSRSLSSRERAADRAERKRLRAERKRIWREENVRPLRENPKKRGKASNGKVSNGKASNGYEIWDVMTKMRRPGVFQAIAETNYGEYRGPDRSTRAAARAAVRAEIKQMAPLPSPGRKRRA